MACLSIRSFGSLEISLDEQPVAGIEYNKVRALLLVLAMGPARAQTRAMLCALLWPDLPERSARNNLSQALTNLRKVIRSEGEPFLLATNEAVHINPASDISIEVDVCRFESLLEDSERHAHQNWYTCALCIERLQTAMQLYQANFLAEFSLPDSAPFEEWAQIQRERLHQQALSMLGRLTRAAEWRGQRAQAIEYARQQVSLDPLNEDSHRDLIRLLARDDQLAAARSQYDNLRTTLEQELGAEPEPTTQALFAQLNPASAPKLTSFEAPPSALPTPPTALIGREPDVAAVTHLFRRQAARLVTLVGPAGVGKTRLALSLAPALRFDYTHGAQWVELAPLADAGQVLPSIAQALNLTDETLEALQAHLQNKHLLLVLDNFEHVIGAASLIAELLARAPGLAVLITSRMALRVRAEQQYALAPLAQPAATELFVNRARAGQFDFEISPDNAADIATICQRLDGLPLAIELIAAQVGPTSPAELVQQLEPLLPMLADGPRDVPERHRTLHDAIDWSVKLLSDTQQNLFAHLAVFAGGFDAAAASAVYAHAAEDLEALARSSLIQAVNTDRWIMLEPIRQFAEARLAALDKLPLAKSRHVAHFVAIAQTAGAAMLGTEATTWMRRLEADHANLQMASQWAMRTQQPELSLRIGIGIFRFWFRRGFWREGLTQLEQALAMNDAHTPLLVRTNAVRAAGVMAQMLSLFERADQHYQDSLKLAFRANDPALIAAANHNLGTLRKDQGRFDEALDYFDESSHYQPPEMLKFHWQSKADTLQRLGRIDEAKALYEKAMALNQRIGDEEGYAHTLRGLAEIAGHKGDADTAERLLRENEIICRRLNHARGLSWTAQLFGTIARLRGNWATAREHYNDALTQMETMGDSWGQCNVLADLGHLSIAEGDYTQALLNLQKAQEGWHKLGAKLTPYEQAEIEAGAEQCRLHLSKASIGEAVM